MKGIWNNKEVLDLFNEVERCKEKNKTLREAFIAHGQKYNRKPNSVRNYYYREVDELEKDKKRLKELGINIERHKKSEIVYFSREDEKCLMNEISRLVGEGVSVRKACYILSKGDIDLMLRFQNKYRNFISKEKVETKPEKMQVEKDIDFPKNNVVTFKKKKTTLSESEVQSLFMGLVRLVKKNAIVEGEEKFKSELSTANTLLRKALTQINSQEREIEKLKEQYSKLKNENIKLNDILLKNQCDKAKILKNKFSFREIDEKIN